MRQTFQADIGLLFQISWLISQSMYVEGAKKLDDIT